MGGIVVDDVGNERTAVGAEAAARPTSSRLAAIDIIRGYCIVSMVSSHLTVGSLFSQLMHPFPAFDGASGFVLLSGLVLGIVQSKRVLDSGLPSVERKTVRRIVVILIAQVSLVILGIITAVLAPHPSSDLPLLGKLSAEQISWGFIGMSFAPPPASVLRLYIVLLALAMGAYWLLSRGRWISTLIASIVLYAFGWVAPELTSFRRFDSDALGANWATWQLMFMIAIIIGWHWRSLQIARRLKDSSLWVALAASLIIVGAYFGEKVVPELFAKAMFAPGRIVAAFAVVTLLYVIVSWLLLFIPRVVFRPIEMIGTRSLDSYVIQAIVAITLPAFFAYSMSSSVATIFALGTLLVCWAWAEFRRSSLWPARVVRARRGRS